jgi:hypothetical protein
MSLINVVAVIGGVGKVPDFAEITPVASLWANWYLRRIARSVRNAGAVRSDLALNGVGSAMVLAH